MSGVDLFILTLQLREYAAEAAAKGRGLSQLNFQFQQAAQSYEINGWVARMAVEELRLAAGGWQHDFPMRCGRDAALPYK